MAPNTNLKAVALFGCSPKDLELIIGNNNNPKQSSHLSEGGSEVLAASNAQVLTSPSIVLSSSSTSTSSKDNKEGLVTPAPSFDDRYNDDGAKQQANSTESQTTATTTHNSTRYDSDKYWEDVADSDTLWHYHGVTAHRMEARRIALARVLNRLEEKKSFEKEATSDSVTRRTVQQKAEQSQPSTSTTPHHDDDVHGYWDELNEEEQRQRQIRFHGRVALPEIADDSNDYWTMNNNDEVVDEQEEEDDDDDILLNEKQETAATKERRHCTTLRIQQEVRLLARLNEFRRQQPQQNDMFSVDHMIELERAGMMKKNATVVGGVPVGVGADYWDW